MGWVMPIIIVSLIGLAVVGGFYFFQMIKTERAKKLKRNRKRLKASKGMN
jgi:uncharacterized integral membrane protein